MSEFVFTAASTDEELRQILDLQCQNVEERLEREEVAREGFVTVRHDLPLLRDMNRAEPHVIALFDGSVAGYALVMLRGFEERVPVLGPMFAVLDGLEYAGRPLKLSSYFVMGQVCVAKPFRGQGVFDGLFRCMRDRYAARYELVVTEVARRNTRSLRAHSRVGFERLHRYHDPGGEEWDVVAWDWH